MILTLTNAPANHTIKRVYAHPNISYVMALLRTVKTRKYMLKARK